MKPIKQLITFAIITLTLSSCSSDGLYTITEAKPDASTDIEAVEAGNKLLGKKVNITWYDSTAKIEINGHTQIELYKQSNEVYTGKGASYLGTDEYTLKVTNKSATVSEVEIDIYSHTGPSNVSTMGTTYYANSDKFTLLAKRD